MNALQSTILCRDAMRRQRNRLHAQGRKLVLANMVEGRFTTNTITKMLEVYGKGR